MITNNRVDPSLQEQTPRHELTGRGQLTDQLVERYGDPAVATYALAVRDLAESHPDVGRIDTWRKIINKIMHDRDRGPADKPSRKPPMDKAEQDKLRKKLSWHFSVASRGPAWQVVELLVRHLVTPDDKAETLAHLKILHKAARGAYPVSTEPTEDAAATTDENGQIEVLRRENNDLKRQLGASQEENIRLRTELQQLAGRPDPGADDPPRQAAAGLVPASRAGQAGPSRPDRPLQFDLVTPSRGETSAAVYWIDIFPHDPSRITRIPAQVRGQPFGAAERFAALVPGLRQFGG